MNSQTYLEKISPKFSDQVYVIPPSNLSVQERMRRLLSWRNEFNYYKRKCSKTSRSIISIHSEDKPYPVYSHSAWWGDTWDSRDFGREFSYSESFFEQYRRLYNSVPQLAMVNDNGVQSENCEYCMDFAKGKDCYLVTGSWEVRDCLYSTNVNHGHDLIDCDSVNLNNELVYESRYSQNLYHCSFLNKSANCSFCLFGEDLRSCTDCFACVGLRSAKFCMFNEQLSEAECRRRVNGYNLGSFDSLEALKREYNAFLDSQQLRKMYQINCESCQGDVLINCRDTWGFDTFNAEHCRYFFKGDGPKYSAFIYQSGNPQWCYESITPDDSYNCCFTTWCWKDRFVFYSDNCHSSEYLFGCVGVKRGKYMVLNKQYSKDEFEKLVPRIIEHMKECGEWGEFFPGHLSPFGYNETVAQEHFPLTRDEAQKRGLPWYDAITCVPQSSEFDPPDHIDDVGDEILEKTLSCIDTGIKYRVTRSELKFYRKMRLPIPRRCPQQRRRLRLGSGSVYDFNLLPKVWQ